MTPKPLGLGYDVGRFVGAVALGVLAWGSLWWLLRTAVEVAVREGRI